MGSWRFLFKFNKKIKLEISFSWIYIIEKCLKNINNFKSYKDVITLRTKYRIVGSLVGLLPKSPLQNIFSSLPLHLLPEEVSLLLEKGILKW